MKFRTKMTLSMLCLMSVIFGIGGSLIIYISFEGALQREKDSAVTSYQGILSTLSLVDEAKGFTDYDAIGDSLEALSAQNASAFSAFRLTSSDEFIYSKGEIPSVETTKPENVGECIYSIEDKGSMTSLYFAGAISLGGNNLLLEASRDITPIYNQRQSQLEIYYRVFLVMSVICAALAYSISRFLTGNISMLSRATKALAGGNLSYRSKINSKDEIGLVAANFNLMAEKLEENVNSLKDAAQRQENFMGSFAHEIKTPMTSIIGYADLIRSETLSPEEQREAGNYIFTEGKRLEALSIKLLNILVTESENAELVPCYPGRIINGIVSVATPIYKKRGIELSCTCQKGSCRLDPDLFKSLIYNLIDNSAKAMDKEGVISVELRLSEEGCYVVVTDNGRGIPEEALRHITDAFYRVDKARARNQGGAGLGLALCKKIVDLHGGTINFKSAEGQGTAVVIELKGGLT